MSYLRYLCLFVNSSVQHILCCVFVRLVCPIFLWIVYFRLSFRFPLDCPLLITPSVFSNVYVEGLIIES
jgi:hypothetical protein